MNYYPPWWGYGPQPPHQNQQNNHNRNGHRSFQREVDKAVRKQLREINRPKVEKRKRKEDKRKAFAKNKAATFHFIEIFILATVCQPFVMAAYQIMKVRMGIP